MKPARGSLFLKYFAIIGLLVTVVVIAIGAIGVYVVNRKAAGAIGLRIPPGILLRADEVIG